MGHINLAVPVAHVWFAYGIPNKMSIVLDMSHKKTSFCNLLHQILVVEIESEKRKDMLSKLEAIKKDELNNLKDELEERVKRNRSCI